MAGLDLRQTPVEPWEGAPSREIWVKRDDLCTPDFGGNKPRKLEYLLGEALGRGCASVVSMGGHGSHHLVATAFFARRLGLSAWGAVFRQYESPCATRNQLLMKGLGLRQVNASHRPGLLKAAYEAWQRADRPYVIGPGGSSPLGTLGFVAAGLELAEQIRQGLLPQPHAIVLPLGSGGTSVGLALGLRLAGLRIPVVAVAVVEPWVLLPGTVTGLLARTARLLHDLGGPFIPPPWHLHVVRGHVGGGYGRPTPGAAKAVRAAGAEGYPLETTYSGKALAALLEGGILPLPPTGRGTALFWLTAPNLEPLHLELGV